MIYCFFTSVFTTLFFVVGTLALYGFYELWLTKRYPLKWACYQHVFVLAIIAVLCLTAAILFGAQIPGNYGF